MPENPPHATRVYPSSPGATRVSSGGGHVSQRHLHSPVHIGLGGGPDYAMPADQAVNFAAVIIRYATEHLGDAFVWLDGQRHLHTIGGDVLIHTHPIEQWKGPHSHRFGGSPDYEADVRTIYDRDEADAEIDAYVYQNQQADAAIRAEREAREEDDG